MIKIKNDMAPKFAVRDPRVIKHVLELYQQGYTCADISVTVGRKMSTCYAIIREFVQVGAIEGRGSGRKVMAGHEEALELVIKMTEIDATITEIAQAAQRSHGWVVHARMRLRSEGLMPAAKHSTHQFVWSRDSLVFKSWREWDVDPPSSDKLIQTWTYKGQKDRKSVV